MDHTALERTPLQSVPWLQWEQVTACLQFKMVDGVQPVLQHQRPLTSMESLQLVAQTVKAEDGQIKFTCLSADQLLAHVVTSLSPRNKLN